MRSSIRPPSNRQVIGVGLAAGSSVCVAVVWGVLVGEIAVGLAGDCGETRMVLSRVGIGETEGSGRSVGSPVLLQPLIIELITRAMGMILFSQLLVTEDAPENPHRLIVYYREQDSFVRIMISYFSGVRQ